MQILHEMLKETATRAVTGWLSDHPSLSYTRPAPNPCPEVFVGKPGMSAWFENILLARHDQKGVLGAFLNKNAVQESLREPSRISPNRVRSIAVIPNASFAFSAAPKARVRRSRYSA